MYINLDRKLWKSLIAEFVGAMFLNFFGCGACVASGCYGYGVNDDNDDHVDSSDIALVAALAFGGIIIANIVILSPVSGCQINPAVTIAFATIKMMPPLRAFLYVIVQIAGCTAGTGLLRFVCPVRTWTTEFAVNQINTKRGINLGTGFGYEGVMTFILMFVVLAVTDINRPEPLPNCALSIGFTVIALVLCGIFATTTGLNPARSLGSAIVSLEFNNLWLFIIAPICGAIIAANFYYYVFKVPGYVLTDKNLPHAE